MKRNKDITINDIKKVSSHAISQFNINRYIDTLESEELVSICNTENANIFSDMNIVDNEVIRGNFPWEQLHPKRACRIMARLIDTSNARVMDEIEFSKMKVKLKDIKPILLRDPTIIHRFKKDISKISDVEAAFLLEFGSDYLLKNIQIKGRRFTSTQQYTICKAYNYRRDVIMMFNPKDFDGFHIAEILKKTHRENIDILHLDNMKLIDWVNVLDHSVSLYDLCDVRRFKKEPIMFLIDIAIITDDNAVYDMILNGNLNEVTPFGWKRLIEKRPDIFISVCDVNKYDPSE